jgi:hypothetical protein
MQQRLRFLPMLVPMVAAMATAASAVDIPVAASKLNLLARYRNYVVRDVIELAARDHAVTKGGGTDPFQISVTFDVAYGKWHGKGQWNAPRGARWSANDSTRALYFDPDPGSGSRAVRKAVIRPNSSLGFTAWSFDFQEIHPDGVGAPNGPVYTSYCVTNGAETNCHCTEFPTCTYFHSLHVPNEVGKVRCKRGIGDPTCRAKCSDPVDQGATMVDGCSHLEWEKKDTAIDSGTDPTNPHDVDNTYAWAGRCSLDATLCQPTPAAAALCAAQTGGALGCAACGPGAGTCDATVGGGITTVWDWLDGLNASGFGGHGDWRLPTDGTGSVNGSPVDAAPLDGTPAELKSLADHRCNSLWCASAALGPSKYGFGYWTSTSTAAGDRAAVDLVGGSEVPTVVWVDAFVEPTPKDQAIGVRAVRSAP